MNDQYVDRLIQSYLDNGLTEPEQQEFAAIMSQSESARIRFWELAEIHGLAPQAVAMLGLNLDEDSLAASATAHAEPSMWSRASSFTRRRQSGFALAGGVLLGVLISAFAWPVRGMPQLPTPTRLTTEGFESGSSPAVTGLPTIAAQWSGDFSEVVTAKQEVFPAEGEKMLQILRADYEGKPQPEGSYCGDLYQIIDVRSLRDQLSSDGTIVHASAMFNMSRQPEDEHLRYTLRILALTSDLLADGKQYEAQILDEYALATARQNLPLDNDPRTWEKAQTELRLPAKTDFVLIHVGITYGYMATDVRRITFPGQFVDDIQISLSNFPR
ncbi:hypothetical protein LOC68_09335 [Blastopirellula sp. JC732]|uniref:Uncharacterized protein n=1 Tax=Blastopirellula sediminis TaxID=2894196 RepID=A0A9X1MKW4_9BACT|nr:hypothetical protein [Blastopirellula sediminis]MCC9608624.1 hypothetical protein [Blastopirellula sediminis]MCC9628599.1 hypothetical protein [Blastopirellula sediminis]